MEEVKRESPVKLTMVFKFKLDLEGQKHWRRINDRELVAKFVAEKQQHNKPPNCKESQGMRRLPYTAFDNMSF
jgi:hypothetical protein